MFFPSRWESQEKPQPHLCGIVLVRADVTRAALRPRYAALVGRDQAVAASASIDGRTTEKQSTVAVVPGGLTCSGPSNAPTPIRSVAVAPAIVHPLLVRIRLWPFECTLPNYLGQSRQPGCQQ